MSDNAIMGVIRKLDDEIDSLQAEIKKKKQAINILSESIGQQPPYEIEDEVRTNQPIRPDLFYGKVFAAAAAEYLRMKKQATSAQEIMENLEKGGFEFTWSGDVRLRNVAISLAKNSQLFHKLPNNTFGLLEFYPDRKKKTKAGELIKKLADVENSDTDTENIAAEVIAENITKSVDQEEPIPKTMIRRK